MLYVNVYEMRQCYGGPEEGGWWFDAIEPIQEDTPEGKPVSFRAKRMRQAERIARRLEKQYTFSENRYTSAANYDGNYKVYIEEHPPIPADNYQPYS